MSRYVDVLNSIISVGSVVFNLVMSKCTHPYLYITFMQHTYVRSCSPVPQSSLKAAVLQTRVVLL